MAEVTLELALDRTSSKTARIRLEGLADLRHIFTQNKSSKNIEVLSDKNYHQIFETLFKVAKTEKSTYSGAKSSSQKDPAASRLSACAAALRSIVEIGVPRLRLKTVIAVLDHVTQTLEIPGGGYCEPLKEQYFKVLRIILESPGHLEHLSSEEWHNLAGFTIRATKDLVRAQEEEDLSQLHDDELSLSLRRRSGRSATPSLRSASSFARLNGNPSRLRHNVQMKDGAEDVIVCLKHIARTSNGPVLEKAQTLVDTLIMFIASSTHHDHVQQAAFETLNAVLSLACTNDVSLSLRIITDLIPLIRRRWSAKSPFLNDHMMVSLLLGEPYLPRVVAKLDDDDEMESTGLLALIDVMKDEYCRRNEGNQMQIDDLDLLDTDIENLKQWPFSIRTFRLKIGTIRAESFWSLIYLTASVIRTLQSSWDTIGNRTNAANGEPSVKRRRTEGPVDSLIERMRMSALNDKIYSLQVLCFVLDAAEFEPSTLLSYIETILVYATDKNSSLCSWAMLALSSAAGQGAAHDSSITSSWIQLWRVAARGFSSISTCRAASRLTAILLDNGLVQYTDIADTADGVLSSIEINGPISAVDSALHLCVLLAVQRCQENSLLAAETADRLLNWLFHSWRPGPLAQARYRCLDGLALMRYLSLDQSDQLVEMKPQKVSKLEGSKIALIGLKTQTLAFRILDYLIAEISVLLQYLKTCPRLTASLTSVVTNISIVSYSMLGHPEAQKFGRQGELKESTDELFSTLVKNILTSDMRALLSNGITEVLAGVLPDILKLLSGKTLLSQGILTFLQTLSSQSWRDICSGIDSAPAVNTEDGEMPDDDFAPRASNAIEGAGANRLSHSVTAGLSDEMAFRNSLASKLVFISNIQRLPDESYRHPVVTRSIVEDLTALPPSLFVCSRHFVQELFTSEAIVGTHEARTLLEYIGQELLQSYAFERSENAMGIALDILTGVHELWTNPENTEVSDLGMEIYDWFILIAVERRLASPHVLICTAALLQRLIRSNLEFGKSLDLPSARTRLFKVLDYGNLDVKFTVGNSISEIFGLFVLKEHEKVLTDVMKTLPNASDKPDHIAMRLYILYHLAKAWPTLLRRCVYAIYETPSAVPQSADHAKWCLAEISKSLRLGSAQELFKLFAPQILYTWLATSTLELIPFAIFGYDSLKALLHDVQDEIVAQTVMRRRTEEGAFLAKTLGRPLVQIIEQSIGKAAGYSIAQDFAFPPSKDAQTSGAEASLRMMLGKARYATLLSTYVHDVLLTTFKTTGEAITVERAFIECPAYKDAQKVYEEMTAASCSSAMLPINQQPSFQARWLLHEITHICRRANQEVDSLWSPPLYIYLFRGLLDTIHPSLGSQHACSVIRKLRILISLAGTTALNSYAIEMALQALRPFLLDMHCSEDSVGIFKYLLKAGESYMKAVPKFVAGLGIVTLINLKVFLNLSQESTTQESQYRATMTKAEDFHKWLGVYMIEYSSGKLSSSSMSSFSRLIEAARNVRASGNAQCGTYESDLLLELLNDLASSKHLIREPSRKIILRQLCADFVVPPSFRDDIFGLDSEAASFAPTLWKMLRYDGLGDSFHLWVGRVLGRAYAATGYADRRMTLEVDSDVQASLSSGPDLPTFRSSESCILKDLCNMLQVEDRQQVSIVEKTLRLIISRSQGTDFFSQCEQSLPPSVILGLLWKYPECLARRSSVATQSRVEDLAVPFHNTSAQIWVQKLTVALALEAKDDILLSELADLLTELDGVSEALFPFVIHLTLSREAKGHQNIRQILSSTCQRLFDNASDQFLPHLRIMLRTIIYLRKQPLPQEASKADRSQWLSINYNQAASAAVRCSMFKTALLFLDIGYSEAAEASRRSSNVRYIESTELLLQIYRSIDEQDAFYGVQQPSSLSSMMTRLEYEHAGFKSLSFRGAHYDSQIRFSPSTIQKDEEGMVQALEMLDLNGLSQSLLGRMTNLTSEAQRTMLSTARRLERWDLPVPVLQADTANFTYRAFQSIHNACSVEAFRLAVDVALADTMLVLRSGHVVGSSIHDLLGTLAILTEADEVCSVRDQEQLEDVWLRFEEREDWMYTESFDHLKGIMSCRETTFSSLSKSVNFQNLTRITPRDARIMEVRALLSSSQMTRRHGLLQNALAGATYLNRLVQPCNDLGLDISAAVQFESAGVLWDQGEMAASINMLQELDSTIGTGKHIIHVGKPQLLAKLGHEISEARLEKPDEIINRYLVPAIRELRGVTEGTEAGQVFHEFASFCDQQLQNPDSLEDFERIQKLRQIKEDEVHDLDKMIKSAGSQAKEKDNLKQHRNKAKLWFDLDDREFQRLRENRQAFLRQSIENYLLALKACDKYDNGALRFSALWLQFYDSDIANEAVGQHLAHVGSRKFASMMNQWASRLQDAKSPFQRHLASLVFRICLDHPFHGMYQIFAGSKTKGGRDDAALGRNRAVNRIVDELKAHKRSGPTWISIHNSNILFVRFAVERLDDSKIKPGSKVALRKSTTGQRLEQDIENFRVPPPTMKIDLRADCDYSTVPRIERFNQEFTVASGISMPKIISAIADDGTKYKQLFKSGNDDLRQDAIMEQVFEQVSNLLRAQRATRQRNLGIRTYKVLPLTATSGIIEFVPNTIPLHDYLMPAHQSHFPKDLKPSNCRKAIAEAQNLSADKRIKVYRSVCNQFHPVLRYFFQERFENPDDWFDRKLAYTRSTAAISILGHILGLGDRHGHNILLDEKTGEVVHIDLGIAFEQGRVLPVPEVVPFRLTRDLVDGMGITGTEGVFRRCCEFTLEALREESYSIMTILDVLRYDPLYNWSLSPLRLKKLQEAQTEAPGRGDAMAEVKEEGGELGGGKKKGSEQEGEADRALMVVKKKLSKSLSVVATVNELVQVATDERNLALLFAGRLVRLIPSSNAPILNLFNHRLPSTSAAASLEFSTLLDLTSPLYKPIPAPQALLIRSILSHLHGEILKRTRPPSSTFNFQSASIGNLFLTGARLFSGSFESAIYLLAIIGGVDESRTAVLPAIVSNFTHHISAGLEDGTVITGQNAISHPSAPTALAASPTAVNLEEQEPPYPSLSRRPEPPTDTNGNRIILSQSTSIYPLEDATLPGSLPTLSTSSLTFSKSSANTHQPLPSRIQRIWYINPYGQEMHPAPNPKAISAIRASDAVIYSIGSLYTSLAPSLVLRGVGDAIANERGGPRFKILILNGSLDRETGGYAAVDFVRAVVGACCESSSSFSSSEAGGSRPLMMKKEVVTRYVTHVVHIDHPSAPVVDRELLASWGVECVRLYGRKGEEGKMLYDERALAQALGMLLGRRDGKEKGDMRSRRNTIEGG
ncbi:MAG: hypothetical protein Q9220_005304 [cf. Caloplaca sp. 1 TL-2023]